MSATVFFDILTRRDARDLARWWNGHSRDQFEVRRSPSNRRFWAVYRVSA